MNDDQRMTITEAARYLAISQATVLGYIFNGIFSGTKQGTEWMIPFDEVKAHKQRQQAKLDYKKQGFLTVKQIATRFGLSPSTIHGQVQSGKLHGIKVNNQFFFSPEEVERYASERRKSNAQGVPFNQLKPVWLTLPNEDIYGQPISRDEKYYASGEASKYLGIQQGTLQRKARGGKIVHRTIVFNNRKFYIFPASALIKFKSNPKAKRLSPSPNKLQKKEKPSLPNVDDEGCPLDPQAVYLNTREIHEIYGLGLATLRSWISQGVFTTCKINGQNYITRAEIETARRPVLRSRARSILLNPEQDDEGRPLSAGIFFSINQAANVLGCSPSVIEERIESGQIEAYQINGGWFISHETLGQCKKPNAKS